MARSAWRCRGCNSTLGWLHRGSKTFKPAPGVTMVWHGVSGTAICRECGIPRVFAGYTMELKAAD